MKHIYSKPNTEIVDIHPLRLLKASGDSETDTTPVYPDDPQDPGHSLTRHSSVWDNDEES